MAEGDSGSGCLGTIGTIIGVVVGLGVLGLVGLGVCTAFVGKSIEEAQEQREEEKKQRNKKVRNATDVGRFAASTLISEYKENEVAADEKYKGKILEVSGEIDSIDKMLGEKIVKLSGGGDLSTVSVNVKFQEKSQKKIPDLKKGSSIVVRGICNGLSGTGGIGSIDIKHAVFIEE